MKYYISFIFIAFTIFTAGIAQEAAYPVKNYTTRDYGRDFHPSNMSVVQDNRGLIYAANGFKLLEFDGHSWNSYPITREMWILSLAADNSGIIYAGAQNEFGYFVPDKAGELRYVSLSDSLDINDMNFTNIWKVSVCSDGVVYQSEEKLFLFSEGKIKVISSPASFHTSFVVDGVFYARERGRGLTRMHNRDLVRISGGEIFDTAGIFLMLPFSKDGSKILIGTREMGFWLYDTGKVNGGFTKFRIEDPSLFERAEINGGTGCGSGLFAVSTNLNGIILLDSSGTVKTVINREYGLADNEVKQVIADRDQNLWAALNNGISHIGISSPLSFYSEKSGIPGSVTSLFRYGDVLYAGTSSGLFSYHSNHNGEGSFIPAFGLSVAVRCLTEADNSLLAGTDAGLFRIKGNVITRISDNASFALSYSPGLKLLFSGGPGGMTVYRTSEGKISRLNLPLDIKDDIIGIAPGRGIGGDSLVVWAGTRYNGVIRIIITGNAAFSSESYDSADGLPEGPVTPFSRNDGILFATSNGLYSFTDEKEVRLSLPDSLKDNREFLKGYFSAASVANGGKVESVTFIADDDDRIWICDDNKISYLDKKNNLAVIRRPFLGIDVGKINVIYPETNGPCWFGTSDGLIRYEVENYKNYDIPFQCLIRKISLTGNDSVLFSGTYSESDNNTIRITSNQPAGKKYVLPYRLNSVRIDFISPFYESSDKTLYSYQLAKNDGRWSEWKNENYREYTNIVEGSYTFSVKARNVYGTESTVARFTFTVLPPWYRSMPAYILYLISGILLIWLIVRLYSLRLKRENLRLEGIVAERTSTVVRQKDEIEKKNNVLESQKKEIEDSIRYARRIQAAVIPSEKDCTDIFPESFVFFRPLNIVSGDFYWISRTGHKDIFIVADCTGHGVPGAFMSMLGVAFLNEIIKKDLCTDPDVILDNLRERVIHALQQQGASGEARDGMDISVVSIDVKKNKLLFAGANNPLIMIRNNEIVETDGDKMPIGIYENMQPFTRHEITLEKGDVFYMSSDGYKDQFGGPDGKKMKSRKFRQILLEIHGHPLNMQKELIEKNFMEWKGNLNQIDDVIVTGIRIS